MIIDTNFQTPIEVVKYMCDLIPPHAKRIFEPTPGTGTIVKELTSRGYHVSAPEDYFLHPSSTYDCVVMNPPFSSKSACLENAPPNFGEHGMRLGYYFLTECMKTSDNIIALMPWFTISDSDVRLRLLKNFGLISLTALPRKTFQYTRIQTVVMQLQRGWAGNTVFNVFDFRHKEAQPQLKIAI